MCRTAQAPRNLGLDVAFAPPRSLENPAPTSLQESPNLSFLGVGSLVHKLVNFCLLPELPCGDCSGLPSWEIAGTQGAGNTLTSAQQPELGLGGQLEIPVHPTSCLVSLFAILLCLPSPLTPTEALLLPLLGSSLGLTVRQGPAGQDTLASFIW